MKQDYCNLNLSHELKYFHQDHYISLSSRLKLSSINKKNEEMSSHKASLNTLLSLIKNCQLDYINKTNKNNNSIKTKQILSLLKDNLTSILNKKNKTYTNLKNKNELKKKKIQNLIFPTEEAEKPENIKEENIKLYSSEINQLKTLNFQIENEIKNTDFLISQKNQIKSNNLSEIKKTEIFCNNNYTNISKISDILREHINKKRSIFIEWAGKKNSSEMKIKSMTNLISDLKFKIKENNKNCLYTDIDNIIHEVSKENSKSIIFEDDGINNEKNLFNNKHEKMRSNIILNNNYSLNPEKFKRKNFTYSKALAPNIVNNINNNIKNNLNKNLNVNDNINNDINKNNEVERINKIIDDLSIQSFNSSLDSNSLSRTTHNRIMVQELGLLENDKCNNSLLNLSNDNSNTENSNNSNSNNLNNNEINEDEKQNQDNFIFTNMFDNE